MSKHQWTASDCKNLKDAYIGGLPYKLKEVLTIHRNTNGLTVSQLQRDAQETHAKQQKLYHEDVRAKRETDDNKTDDKKDGGKDKQKDKKAAAAAPQEG